MEKSKYYKLLTSEAKVINFNFKEIWQYRDLVFLLVKREFVSKYKQTILGPAWAIIEPLLTTFVFTFIFGNVAGLANCGAVPTFLFYMSGNIAWQFFAGCLTGTADTFIKNSNTMGKVYFPRLCMPISSVLSQFISFGIQFIMFAVLIVIFLFIPNYEIGINFYALFVPVCIVQMSMLGLGCGIIVSAVTTKYRDLQFLVSFGVSLWMYGTPVAYSLSTFSNSQIISMVCKLNPVTPIIELIRYGTLGPEAGSILWGYYALSWVSTIVILLIGVLMFNRVERTFMDTV